MKLKTTVIAIAALGALLTLSTPAEAQRQNGGGGGQGRRGGMMGMGQRGGMGNMAQSPAFLLMRRDVQDDLKLTDKQKDDLNVLREDAQKEMMAKFQEMRQGGGQPDREAMTKIFTQMNEENEKKINAILTADQQKRLKEIGIQMGGNAAVLREDIAKEVGLTADQASKIKALEDAQQKANGSVMQKMRSQEMDRDTAMATMKKNGEALDAEIGKILTEAQKKKLADMGGAPFKRVDENGR